MRLIAMAMWEGQNGRCVTVLEDERYAGVPIYFESVEDIEKELADDIWVIWLDLDTLETGEFVK